jgi:hypothetical protein
MFGWGNNSSMASIYVHLSGRDLDNSLLKLNGIEVDEKEDVSILKPKVCIRCDKENPATNKFCNQCGMMLDEKTMVEIIENDMERKDADNILDKLMEDETKREKFLGLIKEVLNDRK